jgi:hypothetical protein
MESQSEIKGTFILLAVFYVGHNILVMKFFKKLFGIIATR